MKLEGARSSRAAALAGIACLIGGLSIGFAVGRSSAPGPDAAAGRAGAGAASRAAAPGAERSTSGAAAEPDAGLAYFAEDRAGSLAELRSHVEAEQEAGNPLGRVVEIASLIQTLGEGQLPGALDAIADLKSPFTRSLLTSTLFMRWTEVDPAEAMRRAESLGDRVLKNSALQGTFVAWIDADPESAWSYVSTGEAGPDRVGLISRFLVTVGASDPKTAVQYAERIEDPDLRRQALTSASAHWANSDPGAALAWAESQQDEMLVRSIRPSVIGTLAARNPEYAFDLALEAPDRIARQNELGQVIRAVAASDPKRALELLQRVPEDMNPETLTPHIAAALGPVSIEQIDKYADRIADPRARDQLLQGAVQAKIRQGATDDAEHLLYRIQEGTLRNNSYRQFTSSWSSKNPEAAQEWLGGLPPGDDRDFAIVGFSEAVVRQDPKWALSWASSIDKTYIRTQALNQVARMWINSDRAEAASWVQASDLFTPEEKHKLLVLGR